MRNLVLVALLFAGCGGGSANAVLISCGAGATCDVGSGKACCVSSMTATCTSGACMGPAFTCLSAGDCTGTKLCCVNDLGSRCAPTCDSTESQACASNTDCAALVPSGQTCTGGKNYTTTAGQSLFSISYCVL